MSSAVEQKRVEMIITITLPNDESGEKVLIGVRIPRGARRCPGEAAVGRHPEIGSGQERAQIVL